jgi:hypothetical protein
VRSALYLGRSLGDAGYSFRMMLGPNVTLPLDDLRSFRGDVEPYSPQAMQEAHSKPVPVIIAGGRNSGHQAVIVADQYRQVHGDEPFVITPIADSGRAIRESEDVDPQFRPLDEGVADYELPPGVDRACVEASTDTDIPMHLFLGRTGFRGAEIAFFEFRDAVLPPGPLMYDVVSKQP